MRQTQNNKQRPKGRSRKVSNPLTKTYESNGPDVKIKGTAQQIADKYIALARDASSSGDRVVAESLLQHAEHYLRIIAVAQSQNSRDDRASSSNRHHQNKDQHENDCEDHHDEPTTEHHDDVVEDHVDQNEEDNNSQRRGRGSAIRSRREANAAHTEPSGESQDHNAKKEGRRPRRQKAIEVVEHQDSSQTEDISDDQNIQATKSTRAPRRPSRQYDDENSASQIA